ncbi:hypothetical protein [Mucilaginibacter terrae]|uniref:DUF4239 domain-containing protein n=1 Tax=Mucilaginibacter terrae TaxID=1955052 RepID=A0ABU3GRB5_9SPHI|nr:hypothetical protein [Mucilaginibacter terrae]MDT3402312.1 hypothetical protein [Mucilaginibacter terrae]
MSIKALLQAKQQYYSDQFAKVFDIAAVKKTAKKWNKQFFGNPFNLASIIVGLLTIGLMVWFLKSDRKDPNYTYYLISISAIYSTIALTYLLQKISSIRATKETLLNSSIDKWKQLSYYRYLLNYLRTGLKGDTANAYNRSRKLGITIFELFRVNMDQLDKVDQAHYQEINQLEENYNVFDFTLLVKMLEFSCNEPEDAFLALIYPNRTYAYGNRSVNDYLNLLNIQGVYDQLEKVVKKSPHLFVSLDQTLAKIAEQELCQQLTRNAGLTEVRNDLTRMKQIESYLVREVLLPLHDATFLIEKQLPGAFIHLLVNATAILFFGTVAPLINAFTFQCNRVVQVCGSLTAGLLLLSIVLVCLTFVSENNSDVFKYSGIIYRGRNDKIN